MMDTLLPIDLTNVFWPANSNLAVGDGYDGWQVFDISKGFKINGSYLQINGAMFQIN